jgi:hypothetical protein
MGDALTLFVPMAHKEVGRANGTAAAYAAIPSLLDTFTT